MAGKIEIDAACRRLENKWDAEGDCKSCGWHACLYEHMIKDSEISEALDNNNGVLELSCQNYEYGDPVGHRGIEIDISG